MVLVRFRDASGASLTTCTGPLPPAPVQCWGPRGFFGHGMHPLILFIIITPKQGVRAQAVSQLLGIGFQRGLKTQWVWGGGRVEIRYKVCWGPFRLVSPLGTVFSGTRAHGHGSENRPKSGKSRVFRGFGKSCDFWRVQHTKKQRERLGKPIEWSGGDPT